MASPDLSALVIPLLKGVIYQEADAGQWNALLPKLISASGSIST